MVYMIIDEDEKVRKFKTLERAEKFMQKREGIYFVIQRVSLITYIGVYESKNGELTKKKVEHVYGGI